MERGRGKISAMLDMDIIAEQVEEAVADMLDNRGS